MDERSGAIRVVVERTQQILGTRVLRRHAGVEDERPDAALAKVRERRVDAAATHDGDAQLGGLLAEPAEEDHLVVRLLSTHTPSLHGRPWLRRASFDTL